jgi:outer membrane protein
LKNKKHVTGLLALSVFAGGCFSADPEMWAEHKIAQPQESWSQNILAQESRLKKGEILTLLAASEIALEHHPDLLRGKSSFEVANARVGQALSAFFPQISLGGSYSESTSNSRSLAGSHRSSKVHANDASRSQSADVGVSLLIFDFGRTEASHKRAKHQAQSAKHDTETIILSTLLNLREAYFNYLEQMALTEVASQTVQSFEKHYEEIEKFYEVGRRTKSDLASAKVDLSESRLAELKAQNTLQKARLRLNAAMGLEEDPGYEVEKEVTLSVFDISQKDAVAQSRESRPDLKAAWQDFRAGEQSLIRAKGGHYPSLNLGAGYSFGGKKTPLIRNWNLGPSFSWTLFDGFNTTQEIVEARASLRNQRSQLALSRQTAYLEVNESWLDKEEAKKRIDLAKDSIEAAEESLRLVAGRYKAGRATRLERSDAELALARARVEEVSSRFDFERRSAKLLESMGLSGAEKNNNDK